MSQLPASHAVPSAQQLYERIRENVSQVIHGQDDIVRKLLASLVSGGHVLLEDYPGTGKTTLAKAIAGSITGMDFKRMQFTPDLLPSDILGVSIFDPRNQEFHFHPGPVFTHVLLADEINRASPRTQSALLEAMGEQQVTVEGKQHRLAHPFFVIATQNPVEFRGTYPLPEAQMDRFGMQLALGYVDRRDEIAILSAQQGDHPVDALKPCATLSDIESLIQATEDIRVSEEIMGYIVDLVGATREVPEVQLAASPRAALALMKAARALALFEGRAFVSPDDVQELAPDVIAHRLVLDPQAKFSGLTARQIVDEVVTTVDVPA